MKKAFLVTASVTTRVVIDVPENGKLDDVSYDMAVELAKDNLLRNLNSDYLDCIEDVKEDFEMPYVEEKVVDSNVKPFYANGVIIVCRGDYENMACPMYATEFDDSKMQDLAEEIYLALTTCYYFNESSVDEYFQHPSDLAWEDTELYDDIDTAFWTEMENIALEMGMRYYEDMTDEEYNSIKNKK